MKRRSAATGDLVRFRTVCGALLIIGIGLLVLADNALFKGKPLGTAIMVLVSLMGWLEFSRITGICGIEAKSHRGLHYLGMASVLFFAFLAWISGSFQLPGGEGPWMLGGFAVPVLVGFSLVVFREHFDRFYITLLETILGVILFGFLFSYFIRIYRISGWEGPVFWAILVAGVKGNDTAAYYVGKKWGRRHIFKVSPNKTLEGSLGAFIFSVAYFAMAAGILSSRSPNSFFPWPGGILFGMIISVVSQLGDLGESLMKRVYRIKDSGRLLPEFGGVLDMIDSLIFTGFPFWVTLGLTRPAPETP